ncbi:MAG: cysteine desulfurase family protein [Anaerolineae bacterium]
MSQQPYIYLDHAASTPVAPKVVQAMLPYFSDIYGNPSGLHKQGRAGRRAVEEARRQIAGLLNCTPKEIVFTSGGSEADNMAIRGVAWAQKFAGRGTHIITSPIEHGAVGKTIAQLADKFGFAQTRVPVDRYGMVKPADVDAAIRPDTILISIMAANNEVGTLQPIAQIGAIARERGVPFHTDSVQAVGTIPLDTQQIAVDMLAFSAHKFYGPKGVGLLYLRRGTPFVPHSTGGGHEGGRRPGTENVPYIVGLATALKLALETAPETTPRLTGLRDRLIQGVLEAIPGAHLTGHPTQRLPNSASFVFEDCDATTLLMHLDMLGIGAASGSACDTGMPEPSGVLLAMGVGYHLALGALRLTLGKGTTEAEIDFVLEKLPQVVQTVRRLQQAQQLPA